eukprot:226003_1
MALEKANQKYDGGVGGFQDISKKKEAEPERVKEVQGYLSQVVGEQLNGDLFEELKDGTILCRLLNGIKPGTCKKFKTSKIAFVARSNISIYLEGCKTLGLEDLNLFETRDLFDNQRPWAVLDNIYAVSAFSRKLDFQGPFIGYKIADPNKRNFTKEQLEEANKKMIADSILKPIKN